MTASDISAAVRRRFHAGALRRMSIWIDSASGLVSMAGIRACSLFILPTRTRALERTASRIVPRLRRASAVPRAGPQARARGWRSFPSCAKGPCFGKGTIEQISDTHTG